MSIALPPPVTPQLAPIEALRAQAGDALVLDYRGIHLHLFGPLIGTRAVDPELLRKRVAAAETISDAVRQIGYLHYAHGYPAVLVSYGVAGGQDLYIRVAPGRVSAVRGPQELAAYFDDLPRQPVLRDSTLEADRALADARSERAGESYRPQFRPGGGDTVVLDLGQAEHSGHQTAAVLDLSNYGNRYSGPYLAQAGLRQSFSSGDELALAGLSSLRFLGLGGAQSEPYHEGDLGWTRVTRYGVFGLEGRYARFRQSVPGAELGGLIGSGGLSWLLPLYADFQHRLNFDLKADRSYESIDAPSGAGKTLSEGYNSAEAGLGYTQRIERDSRRYEIKAALDLRKGLSRDYSGESAANLAYLVLRPAFALRYEPNPHWGLGGEGRLQLGGSSVPQLEQFVIGGPTSLHAYEAGVGVGDRGESYRLGADWKDVGDSWIARHQLQPAVFVEYGSTRLNQKAVGENSGRVALADAGLEVRLRFTSWLGGTLSGAQPFYRHGEENSPDGLKRKSLYFDLAARF
jgi:hemolysin activation/secretion protein